MEIPPRDPNLTPDHRPSAEELARLHAHRRSAVQRGPLDPAHLCHTVNRRLRSPVRQSNSNMPRSFLVKNHHNSRKWKHGKLKPKSEELRDDTDEDSLLHSTISPHQHCPVSNAQLQKAPKAISSSARSHPLRTQLHLPSSSVTPTLSFLGHCSGTYRESSAQSSAEMNLQIQHVAGDSRGRESLQPPSLPLVTIFPAVPSDCSSQERFECLDCHNEHLSFVDLARHKQLQCEWSSKKYFNCKYCEKEYISLGALKMHIRTHTLPCVCKLCGKAFSRPWLLQGHIRTHTGEKPFSCFHCHRAFADRSNLRAHLQTHSEMKRYQCACCLKTFSRISLLAKHQEAGCLLS